MECFSYLCNELGTDISLQIFLFVDKNSLLCMCNAYELIIGDKNFWKDRLMNDYEFADDNLTKILREKYCKIWITFSESKEFDLNKEIINASNMGNYEIVKLLLLDERINPDIFSYDAICGALKNAHPEILKLLLEKNTFHFNAIFLKYIKFIISYLLDKEIDPSIDDNFAIISASDSGDLKIVKLLLLDYRVDPTVGDNTPITLAIHYGYFDIFELLIQDSRVNQTVDAKNLLRMAENRGCYDIVDFLEKAYSENISCMII